MPSALGLAGRGPTCDDFGPDPLIVAYGVGVDNTALLIGLHHRGIRPDLILFADTGSEKRETTAYLPVIGAWLEQAGFTPVTIVKRASPRAGDTSLHAECLRKSVLPSLAYGGHSCSLKWKVDPQWAYMRRHFQWNARQQRWSHGPFVTELIGYDAGPGEARRIANATGKWPPGHRYRYPLTECKWTREHCETVILGEGLPLPVNRKSPKSIGSRQSTRTWRPSRSRWSGVRTGAA